MSNLINPEKSTRNREYAIRRRALLKKKHAEKIPLWANKDAILAIYRCARDLRDAGYDMDVDHIIPLHGKYVSGLHWELNLAIVPRDWNNYKGNQYDIEGHNL